MDTFVHRFLKFKRHYKNVNYKYEICSNCLNTIESEYIPKEVLSFMNNNNNNKNTYKIKLESVDIIIYGEIDDEFIQTCNLFRSFFQKEKEKARTTIYYLPILQEKYSTTSANALAPININSGVFFGNTNVIVVYRKEEALKVLIHELIHCHGFDDTIIMNPNLDFINIISSVPIRFTETYTELLASILFNYYKKTTTYKSLKEHFQHHAKLIMCMYYDANNKTFRQNTHVFEYIIAKAALVKNKTLKEIILLLDSSDNFNAELKIQLKNYIESFKCRHNMLPLVAH